jgi:hypothetical protein
MLIEEQEDVIAMLERLRAKKRYVYYVFPFSFLFLLEKKRGRNEKSSPGEPPRADCCGPQITVARVFGEGDRY